VKTAEQGQEELRARLQEMESARKAEKTVKESLQTALRAACNRGKTLDEVQILNVHVTCAI
jgi:hypothetical protein